MTLCLLVLMININKTKCITQKQFISILLIILLWVFTRVTGKNPYAYKSIVPYVILVIIIGFLLMSNKQKRKAFDIFSTLFAFSLVPGIIYLVLRFCNISISYNILESAHTIKNSMGVYYDHYFGAIFAHYVYGASNRLCSIYDEPGVVGTFAALFLVGDYFNLKKIKNLILIIGGVLSSSIAFFTILLVAYVIFSYQNGNKKFVYTVFCVFILSTIVFNIETDNYIVLNLKNRLQFENGELVADNRTNESFEHEYKEYLASNVFELLFGNGYGAAAQNYRMNGSYSYKILLYDYGICGFVFIIFWIIYTYLAFCRSNKRSVVLLLVFLMSIYQRPDVLTIPFIVLLFGGAQNLDILEKREEYDERM